MVQVDYQIKNEEGLHARPAYDFCKTAGKFQSKIEILKNGDIYDAKSILMVLCVGAVKGVIDRHGVVAAVKGETITIRANGEDEEKAVQALVKTLDAE